MGERKVLNVSEDCFRLFIVAKTGSRDVPLTQKYYPPDFDTIRLPKLPGGRPDQYVIRIMAPFTMR